MKDKGGGIQYTLRQVTGDRVYLGWDVQRI